MNTDGLDDLTYYPSTMVTLGSDDENSLQDVEDAVLEEGRSDIVDLEYDLGIDGSFTSGNDGDDDYDEDDDEDDDEDEDEAYAGEDSRDVHLVPGRSLGRTGVRGSGRRSRARGVGGRGRGDGSGRRRLSSRRSL